MPFVIAVPETVTGAARDLASLGSTSNAIHAAAPVAAQRAAALAFVRKPAAVG
ncbi:PE domain-containing protein [Mycobacterium interjectum]|nr:PE domain-containing protein [Mycobacterium interjectum]